MIADERWLRYAACKGLDIDVFFQTRKNAIDRGAKAICADCPVKLPCRQAGFRNDELGVWGGIDDRERARMKRKMKARVG